MDQTPFYEVHQHEHLRTYPSSVQSHFSGYASLPHQFLMPADVNLKAPQDCVLLLDMQDSGRVYWSNVYTCESGWLEPNMLHGANSSRTEQDEVRSMSCNSLPLPSGDARMVSSAQNPVIRGGGYLLNRWCRHHDVASAKSSTALDYHNVVDTMNIAEASAMLNSYQRIGVDHPHFLYTLSYSKRRSHRRMQCFHPENPWSNFFTAFPQTFVDLAHWEPASSFVDFYPEPDMPESVLCGNMRKDQMLSILGLPVLLVDDQWEHLKQACDLSSQNLLSVECLLFCRRRRASKFLVSSCSEASIQISHSCSDWPLASRSFCERFSGSLSIG